MACFRPLKAYRTLMPKANGKSRIIFEDLADTDLVGKYYESIRLPCGRCFGCRLEYARQWAMRCMHERQMHEDACFVTLTYSDKFLPSDKSLDKRDFQLFMKKLRKAFPDKKIRYYHCGEYGERFNRPHYHALLFGIDFSDKKPHKKCRETDIVLYTSKKLESIWGKGFVTLGDVTFESAAYCARYMTKKVKGDLADDHYWYKDLDTGECWPIQSEYATMSRRPGIGRDWYEKYKHEVYVTDSVILRGKEMKPPRIYDKYFEHEYPSDFKQVKDKRVEIMSTPQFQKRYSDAQLAVDEICMKAKFNKYKRSYESEV